MIETTLPTFCIGWRANFTEVLFFHNLSMFYEVTSKMVTSIYYLLYIIQYILFKILFSYGSGVTSCPNLAPVYSKPQTIMLILFYSMRPFKLHMTHDYLSLYDVFDILEYMVQKNIFCKL